MGRKMIISRKTYKLEFFFPISLNKKTQPNKKVMAGPKQPKFNPPTGGPAPKKGPAPTPQKAKQPAKNPPNAGGGQQGGGQPATKTQRTQRTTRVAGGPVVKTVTTVTPPKGGTSSAPAKKPAEEKAPASQTIVSPIWKTKKFWMQAAAVIALILVGFWGIPKLWNMKNSRTSDAAKASSGSSDIPVTPQNDPNRSGLAGGTLPPGTLPPQRRGALMTNGVLSELGNSAAFGNVTGSNTIVVVQNGDYMPNGNGSSSTGRVITEMPWPLNPAPTKKEKIEPKRSLEVGEVEDITLWIGKDEDVEFVYPTDFNTILFIETPHDLFDTAMDGKRVPNGSGEKYHCKVVRIKNRSGADMRIGFRCIKLSAEFNFESEKRVRM